MTKRMKIWRRFRDSEDAKTPLFTASMAHPSNTDFLVRAMFGFQIFAHPGCGKVGNALPISAP